MLADKGPCLGFVKLNISFQCPHNRTTYRLPNTYYKDGEIFLKKASSNKIDQ